MKKVQNLLTIALSTLTLVILQLMILPDPGYSQYYQPTKPSYIRFVHAVPELGKVDLVLGNSYLMKKIEYGTISDWIPFDLTVLRDFRLIYSDNKSLLLSFGDVKLDPNEAYTIIMASNQNPASSLPIQIVVITSGEGIDSDFGKAKIRVLNLYDPNYGVQVRIGSFTLSNYLCLEQTEYQKFMKNYPASRDALAPLVQQVGKYTCLSYSKFEALQKDLEADFIKELSLTYRFSAFLYHLPESPYQDFWTPTILDASIYGIPLDQSIPMHYLGTIKNVTLKEDRKYTLVILPKIANSYEFTWLFLEEYPFPPETNK